MEDKSLRETIEEAAATAGSDDEVVVDEEVVDEVETAAETEAEEETETEVSGEEVAAEVVEPPPTPDLNAPVDWNEHLKSEWGDLPQEVKQAITERNKQVDTVLQETAGIRDEYDNFSAMIQPYIPLMQAEGNSDPQQAIQGLLNTTATLSMGSQVQKAQKIAAMIEHYGVDIQTLDGMLAGEAPAAQPVAPADPRIDQIWNQMQVAQQQNTQQVQQEAGQNIQQFAADPANVHFPVVRERMADWIDMAGQRGQEMTLQDAYFKACLEDPQIAPLVTAQFANTGTNAAQAARVAASSISGKPAASGHTAIKEDMSLRETIASQIVGDGGRI